MESNAAIARVFKALCDENRVEIIKLIRDGEKCACEIYDKLDITKPTISHHMKILVDSGIVLARKEGKWTHYSLSNEGTTVAQELIQELFRKTQVRECEEVSVCK